MHSLGNIFSLVLKHPDPSKPFVLEVNLEAPTPTEVGVGAILSQLQGKPEKSYHSAFFSKKLNSAERNYGLGNRELLAVILAFEEWRHWLEGAAHPFQILTDHRNLEHIRAAKCLNFRQARWALCLTRFRFTMFYRHGTENAKADSLSRMHEKG